LRKPRTGPGTRCDTGQNGHTKRVPCALGVFSTVTAQPGLHSRYSTCTGTTGANRVAGLAGFGAGRAARTDLRLRATRRAAGRDRLVRDALIIICLNFPSNTRRARLSIFPSTTKAKTRETVYDFLRCTIWLLVRLLCRVFAPSVEKPHGVCGWLPLTRPSPPPCG
jgi:hypothetical protein